MYSQNTSEMQASPMSLFPSPLKYLYVTRKLFEAQFEY